MPDGVEATVTRLQQVQREEAAAQGLPDEVVDARLWPGAAAAGWRVLDGARGDGHYKYYSPAGVKLNSKTEALAAKAEAEHGKEEGKKSARQRAQANGRA